MEPTIDHLNIVIVVKAETRMAVYGLIIDYMTLFPNMYTERIVFNQEVEDGAEATVFITQKPTRGEVYHEFKYFVD